MNMFPKKSLIGHERDIWAWVAIRLALGWVLLWAFLDKLLGLGFATPPGEGWINGTSPTTGYLNFGTGGLFGDLFAGLANNVFVDLVFMAALVLLGTALLLGIGLRIAAVGGSVFFAILWLSNFPPANNPIIDEHVVYIFALIGIALAQAGRYLGLGQRWSDTWLVKRFRFLE
jgi:thiosulfate dehydrogenase [quinone] large subunit